MPSFLSKVFGRKKDDKEFPRLPGQLSDAELLDGKFESVSPSATKFPEVANGKGQEKEKDVGFTLFKSKSHPASPEATEKREEVPHLSLNLPGPKDESASRALGVVFEADPEAQILLSDAVIGSRRLNPLETLILVRACSQAITARGLESLGIMHPHWYSASPEVQRKLISLFIQSLAPKSPITTLAPTSSAFVTAFESEISSTRSPHDVAAVLRWGLRHLQLEGNSFGKEDSWYKTFFDAEQSSNYPANGFSTILGPTLPASHLELLTATLEVFSSLAAHAEANGISGSKLSKFFGLWLLTVQRAHDNDDWSTFYDRWERTGRMLEHLFLSRIRDEAAGARMPTRLLELVKHYPYNKTPSPETDLLSRPRFSTRRYDALFVRIETELSASADRPTHHALRLISDAFKADPAADAGEHTALWETIRKAGTDDSNHSPGAYPGLSHIFADETLRFFSLIPVDNGAKEPPSPTFNLFMPSSHRRSFSLDGGDRATATKTPAAISNGISQHSKPATDPVVTPSSSAIGTDWTTFSTSGFFEDASEKPPLAATLMEKDKDMEVTVPKVAPRPKPIVASLVNGRKSLDTPRTLVKAEAPKPEESVKTISKSTHVSLTQLDEAFIDFWSDALLDPISSTWPAFIICKLKSTLAGVEVDGKRLEWLVLEQTFKRPAPPTPVSPETSTATSPDSARRARPSSPKSFKSDITFSSTLKRFSIFTSGRASMSSEREMKSKKKAGHGPKVGEMGEILAEEDEGKEKDQKQKQAKTKGKADTGTVRVRIPSPKPRKSAEVPRKSVDATKKSVDGGGNKSNGVGAAGMAAGAAAVVTGAAAVGAVVSSDATQPAEPASEALATNGAAVENSTPALSVPAAVSEPATAAKPQTPGPVEESTSASNGSAKGEQAALPAPASVQPVDQPQEPTRLVSETDLLQSATDPGGPRTADLEGAADEPGTAPVVSVAAVEPTVAPATVPEVATRPEPTPAIEPAAAEPTPAEVAIEEPSESISAVVEEQPTEAAAAPVEEVFEPTPALFVAAEPAAPEPAEPTHAVPEVQADEVAPIESRSTEPEAAAEEPAEPAPPAVVDTEVEAAPSAVEEEPSHVVAAEPDVAEVEVAPEALAEDVAEPAPAAVVEPEVVAKEAVEEPADPTPAAPDTTEPGLAHEAPAEDIAEPTPTAVVEPEAVFEVIEEKAEEAVEPTPAVSDDAEPEAAPEPLVEESVSVVAEGDAIKAAPSPEPEAQEAPAVVEPEVHAVEVAAEEAPVAPTEIEEVAEVGVEPTHDDEAVEPATPMDETSAADVDVVDVEAVPEVHIEEPAPEADAAEDIVSEAEVLEAETAPEVPRDEELAAPAEAEESAEPEATPVVPEESAEEPAADIPATSEPLATAEEPLAEAVPASEEVEVSADPEPEAPAPTEDAPVHNDTLPVPEVAAEAQSAVVEESASVDEPAVEVPAPEEPLKEEPTLAAVPMDEVEPTVPAADEDAPIEEEEAAAADKEAAPADEAAAPVVEEAALVVEEKAVTGEEEPVPVVEEIAPAVEEEQVVPAGAEQEPVESNHVVEEEPAVIEDVSGEATGPVADDAKSDVPTAEKLNEETDEKLTVKPDSNISTSADDTSSSAQE